MSTLQEILQKLWAVLPGLLGLFLFLVTLGIFIALTAWEKSSREEGIRRAESERARHAPPQPPRPEPAEAPRERAEHVQR